MADMIRYIAVTSPKQREIGDDLRSRTASGEYLPTSRIPSVAELSRMYGASNTAGEVTLRKKRMFA